MDYKPLHLKCGYKNSEKNSLSLLEDEFFYTHKNREIEHT
jgi:hypothetical protein